MFSLNAHKIREMVNGHISRIIYEKKIKGAKIDRFHCLSRRIGKFQSRLIIADADLLNGLAAARSIFDRTFLRTL